MYTKWIVFKFFLKFFDFCYIILLGSSRVDRKGYFMLFNYGKLLKLIDAHYNMSKMEYKIMALSKDIRVKIYRLKNILDNKSYFQTDEIMRICEILNIKEEDIVDYFFSHN